MRALRHLVSPTLEIALVIVAAVASASFGVATAYSVLAAASPF